MEKLHDLKERICSWDNLIEAYKQAAKAKRYRDEVLSYSFDLERNLLELQEKLRNREDTVGAYREFYVQYPKPRLIMALPFEDRIVQWAIYLQINPYHDKRYINHSYGCRRGKGTLAAAECLLNWQQQISRKPDADEWTLIKGDVSKYFYRVDHEVVLRIYEQYSDDPWVRDLMDTIINNPDIPFGLPPGAKPDDCPKSERLYDVGMPIGNLTSQETANLYLNELDQFVKHTLKIHHYVRYMDDFAIMVKGREAAEEILRRIDAFLTEKLKLSLSPKCRILPATRDVEFVGYIVSPHGLRLRKKITRHIKRSLKKIAEAYRIGELTLDKAMEKVTSYYGMTKHCNGFNLRRWIEENITFTHEEHAEGWDGVYEQIAA